METRDEISKLDQPNFFNDPANGGCWRQAGNQSPLARFPWRSSLLHPTHRPASPVSQLARRINHQQLPVQSTPSSPRDRPTRQEEPGAHLTLSRQFPAGRHVIPQGNCVLLCGGSPARRGQSPLPKTAPGRQIQLLTNPSPARRCHRRHAPPLRTTPPRRILTGPPPQTSSP